MDMLRNFRKFYVIIPMVTVMTFLLLLLWIVNGWKSCALPLEIVWIVLFGTYTLCYLFCFRKKHKQMLDSMREDGYIAYSTQKVFDRFVFVDFEENTYKYLRGMKPEYGEIPTHGEYDRFMEYIISMLVGENDKKMLEPLLSVKSIQANMDEDVDILRYGYHLRRDTVIWENISIICLERKKGTVVKALFTRQNVTELRERELKNHIALKEAFQAAEDANKAKSDFLSRMSHDIRTPLNAIMGMTTIAGMHKEEPERIEDCLNKIETSGKHLIRLVNEVLDMSKIESGRMSLLEEPYLLTELVENVCAIMDPRALEKQIELEFVRNNIVHNNLIGDMQRIEQVAINIIGNAMKFTPEGGKVSVRLTEKASILEGYAFFVLECEDTGIGMSEETVRRIFEPFYRVSDSKEDNIEGTGLGLPIVKNMLRMMNGEICVESEVGKGSKFTISIHQKIQEKVSEQGEDMDGEDAKPCYTGKLEDMDYSAYRVLIVEDNVLNREIACEIFGTSGIKIDATVNGQKAVNLLEERPKEYYDIVFMDVQMPVLNGYEATEKIRNSRRDDIRNIPVIAMTADAFVEDVQRAKAAGMDDHIAKPIEISRVIAMFEKWLPKDRK